MIPGSLVSMIMSSNGSDAYTPATTTMMSSVTLRGVTFNFDREMPVCFSCLGDPVVISTQSFNITSITPNSALVETSAGSGVFRAANGTMINPTGMLMSQQGFDGLLGDNVSTSDTIAYSASLNVDPALSAAISISAGQELSIVKSLRIAGLTSVNTSTSGYRTIDKYVILSVLSSIPAAGFFRPAPAGTVKVRKNTWREDLVDYTVLRSLAAMPGQTTITEAEALIRPTLPFFYPLGNGEKFRRLNTEGTDDNTSINYSRDFGISRANALSALHTNISSSAKRTVFLRAIQHGIDLHGEIINGFTGAGGAGQGYGRQEFPYYAAFGLKDADLLNSARTQKGSTLSQHFWVSAQDVGRDVYWPAPSSQNRFNCATYITSDLGLPEWEQEPAKEVRARNASLLSRYREFWQSGILGAFGVCLLQNGPGGIDGVQAILNNGSSDSSNDRAAALNYYDRITSIPDTLRVFNSWVGWTKSFRDTYRSLISLPAWTGKPDMVEYANNASNYNQNVTAGAGQISYNFSAADVFTTLPLTRHDVRYSLDGVDWIEVSNTGASSGVITGLTRGLAHEVSYRRWSSAGAGRWSPTYEFTAAGGPFPTRRNRVAPTGTTTNAAPINTMAPKIFRNPYAEYAGEIYEESPATLTSAFMQQPRKVLTASLGYWTGYPAPTFAYQWRANGINIPNATSKDLVLNWYTVDGDVIDCQITATNSQGSITVTTNTVTVPVEAEPVLPSTLSVVSNIKAGIAAPTRVVKSGAVENAANGRKGTFAMRGRLLGGDGSVIMFFAQGAGTASTSDCVRLQRISTNQIRITLRSSSAQILQHTSTATLVAGSDFTLLMSWDLDAGVSQIFLNGANAGGTPTGVVAADIPYSTFTPASFFGTGTNTGVMPAQWEYLYFNMGAFVDLTVSGNRDKFLPANIGGWGDEPTGSRPQLFLWGDAETYNDSISNKGIGGIVTPAFAYDDDGVLINDIVNV